jgi:hypothetical protein
MLSQKEKIDLEKLIKSYDSKDNTENIRKLKHGKLIRTDVAKIIELKTKYSRLKYESIEKMAIKQASFLWVNYTNIFIKLMKGKLNVDTLFKFISVLEMIEEGKLDQNEGSVQIGQILKKMYIDTALYESKINNKGKDKKNKKKVKNISWEEFKERI